MNLTIETCLESAIHNVQTDWSDDTSQALKANKQEAPTTNNEEDN